MDIFYLDSNNFSCDDILLDKCENFHSEKRRLQHLSGRFLVKFVGKHFYGLNDVEIGVKNKKPYFLNSDIQFSISHSKNIILVAFDKNPVGVDVEYMRPRDFGKIFKHYNIESSTPDAETFYQFWTDYEAKIKLQSEAGVSYSFKLLPEFMLSVVSSESFDIRTMLKIYELKSPIASTKPSELINAKLVSANSPKENTVVIQEISTASLEFLEPLNLKIE